MKTSLVVLCLFAASIVIAACGDKDPPKSPDDAKSTTSSDVTPASNPTPETTPAAPTEPEPPKKQRKPFEVYNTCNEVVTIVFAEDPKAANAGKRTIAPSATIEGPRDNDGNQTMWILDKNEAPLVKVHVTKGMKRVEVGKSCRTLDAR